MTQERPKGTRAAVYYRVSTSDQAGEDRYGLPAQRHEVESYTTAQGFEIAAEYTDAGISGATIDRPGLQDLLEDAARGCFDVVIVSRYDRVARDAFIALFVEKELLVHGVEVISASEPVGGSDPMAKAFRQVLATFAELEKNMIAARLSKGRRQKARGGGYAGGGAPMGYTAEKGAKVLREDPDKARTVKRLFELHHEMPGATLQAMADKLNEEGHTTARGGRFHPVQVKRILEREMVYKGGYKYAGIEAPGQHIPII